VLKSEKGWLNLVGLFWLKEGENKFGAHSSNDIVFPQDKAADYMGSFFLTGNEVTVTINSGVNVISDSVSVTEMKLNNDISSRPTIMEFGSLRWFIIQRGEKIGIRLRDLDAPLVKNFKGIDSFPVSEKWKVDARYEEYSTPKVIQIPTVLGTVDPDTSYGSLNFIIDEKEFRLDPVRSGDKFFLIFADQTNGEDTYGGGRFLYTNKPDSTGSVTIDFNKAYNPPCAFTKYATCPLPPKENRLYIEITAGEKTFAKSNSH